MTAHTFGSKKAKGKRLEKYLAKRIREKGLDKDAKRMPMSGAIEGFKSDIFTHLPFTFEAKNQEKVALWEWWNQAKAQEAPYRPAVLVVGGNYRPALAVIDLETFLNMILEIKQLNEMKGL